MKNKNDRVESIKWLDILERLRKIERHIEGDRVMTRGDLAYAINSRLQLEVPLERSQISGWSTARVLKYEEQEGKHNLYDRNEIMKAFLAAILSQEYDLTLKAIGPVVSLYGSGFGRDEADSALSVKDVNQEARARLLLYGRILGICESVRNCV
jgi:hypothetical protein